MVRSSRKGVSFVISTIMILTVLIVVFVSFQAWFGGFQSEKLAKIDEKNAAANFEVKKIIDNLMYIEASKNTTLTEFRIIDDAGNVACSSVAASLVEG